jgi:iduronate 2-sulfatase
MENNFKIFLLLILLVAPWLPNSVHAQKKQKRPNILMIIVDDLRPELGCYGNQLIKSPAIDKLAAQGTLFTNAFCNVPVCGASRATIMTGIRPGLNRFLEATTRADVDAPNAIYLAQHLKNNGYTTFSNGKVSHNKEDFSSGWNQLWVTDVGRRGNYALSENRIGKQDSPGPPYEMAIAADSTYKDGKLAIKTIEDLKHLKDAGKPFFMATGFARPHLPFSVPKKYWDMYKREDFKPTARNFWPKNAPEEAFHWSGELKQYEGMPPLKDFVNDSISISLQHGYYASVSFADAQVGLVLNALKDLGLAENTIVLLLGDHGWNLGEHGLWCKHANFNTSLKTPLIISVPGNKPSVTNAMVEFIDIYPTLNELAGLKAPPQLEGISLAPLLKNANAPHKDWVVCKFKNGLTLRTSKHAYTEYRNSKDELISTMLYDTVVDPNETNNLSNDPAHKELITDLHNQLMVKRGADYLKKVERATIDDGKD